MYLVILDHVPILEQLQLEEALLRAGQDNWYLLNTGSPPAIVMGISGKPEELIDQKSVMRDGIPVIKRFSGGGTVYIDPHTVFSTLICNSDVINVPLQPSPILTWSETFYSTVFPGSSLRENDYVFGNHKFGGNAQYIQKDRWLLHTSFLWDYSPDKMHYLLLPQKRPAYRQDRAHHDFLSVLHPRFTNKEELISRLASNACEQLGAQLIDPQDAFAHVHLPHRHSTTKIM